jgi:hypothetical protein
MHYFGKERLLVLLESALTTLLLGAQLIAPPLPAYHVEREPVAGGAELVTVYGRWHESGAGATDVPLLSVLRDTLGDSDPENDRLRYVWVLTSTRPTPVQRIASALSLAYFRGGGQQHADRVPGPLMDLAAPSKTVWPNLLGDGVQALRLDPMGATVRTSTRSYRGNSSEYRKLQVFQALSSLEGLERERDGAQLFSAAELRQIDARLSLSNRTFGGLVREENLQRFYDRQATQREQTRGHNWELLRQRAELCGLYFEPLSLPGSTPGEALLWVAAGDAAQDRDQYFSGQFLNISNPWTDSRLAHWTGYTETRYLDGENRLVAPDMPGARAVKMIPLALYSLDYPRAPLLLVDFRNSFDPMRRELLRRGTSTLFAGVLGIARFGNWSFLAANTAWTFVRGRHGNAVNRSARLEAYSRAREFLSVDAMLDPALRRELLSRLDHLALNPLENGTAQQAVLAREQYAALCQYALAPTGLAAQLERDRQQELDSYTESSGRRFLAGLGRLFKGRTHPNPETDLTLRAELDSYRRTDRAQRFLEQLLASSPQPDVNWDAAGIRHALEALSDGPRTDSRAASLIAQIFSRSEDASLRLACLHALGRLNTEEARNELLQLSQNSGFGSNAAAAPVGARAAQSGTQ